jgi:hypothetical protein
MALTQSPAQTLTDDAIEAARARGHQELASGPIAVEAAYDPARDRVVVELDTGFSLGIPRRVLEGLSVASPEQLQRVEILGPGTAIAWNEPDVGFTIAGLVQGLFSSEHWMAELGRFGGAKRSALKAAAARLNGKKGGRPRKIAAKKKAKSTRKKAASGLRRSAK